MNSHATPPSTWHPRSSWSDPGFDPDTGPESERDPRKASEPIPGAPLPTALAGAAAGAVGGILALGTADLVLGRGRLLAHLELAIGRASSLVGSSQQTVWLRVAFAALIGMFAGAGLAWLMRRLHSRIARVVFGAVLVPSLWIAFDAFALARFAPRLAELVPFLPCLLGALAYGVSVALVRPVVPRWARQRFSVPAGGTASFLLVRRR
jgi:hypothetical protein